MAIVVFDDRVEIQSHGRLPFGVTVAALSGPHNSQLRNPLIAEAFHRTGAVEVWDRGTNRVIAECEAHGIPAPTFEERHDQLIVTFRAGMVAPASSGSIDTAQVTAQVTAEVAAQVAQFCQEPASRTARRPMCQNVADIPTRISRPPR